MNILACQFDIVWEDKAANHRTVTRLLEQAKPEAGALVVLPEMFATGFSMRAAAISDTAARATQQFLAATARAFGVYLAAGVVCDGAGKGRNECVIYDPQGAELARYCKQQPFTPGAEARHYEAGDGPCFFEWAGFRVAPFICYDLRFPEIFRVAVRQGANLFLVIASWPSTRIAHWDALLKARAIENQAYVVGVNRCGQDPTLHYTGHSQIIGPGGEIIASAAEVEGVARAALSLTELEQYRRELPFLADMR